MTDRHCLMCGCGMSPQSTYHLCGKCQRIQQGAAPQVAAPQSTPSLAGTAETMTAERDNPKLLRDAVIECLPEPLAKLCDDPNAPTLGAMLLHYVAEIEDALAERMAECEVLGKENDRLNRACFSHAEALNAAEIALATAQEDTRRLRRANEELTGVIETYGRVSFLPDADRNVLELRYCIDGMVFRAAGMGAFSHAIRECAGRWERELADLRRADRTPAEKLADAFADVERAARPHATPEGE